MINRKTLRNILWILGVCFVALSFVVPWWTAFYIERIQSDFLFHFWGNCTLYPWGMTLSVGQRFVLVTVLNSVSLLIKMFSFLFIISVIATAYLTFRQKGRLAYASILASSLTASTFYIGRFGVLDGEVEEIVKIFNESMGAGIIIYFIGIALLLSTLLIKTKRSEKR